MWFKVNRLVQGHFFMTSTLRLAAILDGPKTTPSTNCAYRFHIIFKYYRRKTCNTKHYTFRNKTNQSLYWPVQASTGASSRFSFPGFRGNPHMKVASLPALHTGRLYAQGNIHGTHFCYRMSRPKGHSTAGKIISIKNCNDTIGNRTRYLAACSPVPQPTAPPRADLYFVDFVFFL
jgi:hypothetical protein